MIAKEMRGSASDQAKLFIFKEIRSKSACFLALDCQDLRLGDCNIVFFPFLNQIHLHHFYPLSKTPVITKALLNLNPDSTLCQN